ncbi:hypothetical protein LshimejAT787_2200650 [Lyophyllum shimeji]|uniref:DUF6532 domain-containing protein n=1 Tax=Lyophyllum shimeji TaxID=47721 RepID=A0A9P3UUR0_LYOSH|nr:hypothetical protein LshimejAT787_2200650 [Lyophyllum shimeji]
MTCIPVTRSGYPRGVNHSILLGPAQPEDLRRRIGHTQQDSRLRGQCRNELGRRNVDHLQGEQALSGYGVKTVILRGIGRGLVSSESEATQDRLTDHRLHLIEGLFGISPHGNETLLRKVCNICGQDRKDSTDLPISTCHLDPITTGFLQRLQDPFHAMMEEAVPQLPHRGFFPSAVHASSIIRLGSLSTRECTPRGHDARAQAALSSCPVRACGSVLESSSCTRQLTFARHSSAATERAPTPVDPERAPTRFDRFHPAQGMAPRSVSSFEGHLHPQLLQSPLHGARALRQAGGLRGVSRLCQADLTVPPPVAATLFKLANMASQVPSKTNDAHQKHHNGRNSTRKAKDSPPNPSTTSAQEESRRERRPSEKVTLQAAYEAEAAAARKAKEERKAARLRRRQEMDSGDDINGDGEESDDGGKGFETTFSTRSVQSKPMILKAKALVERDARVPLSNVKNTHADGGHTQARGRSPTRRDVRYTRGSNNSADSRGFLSPTPHHRRSSIQSPDSLQFYHRSRSISPQDTGNDPVTESSPSNSHKRHASASPAIRSTQALRLNSTGGRPKAGDYDDVTQEYIYHAITLYRVLLSTDLAFPNHQQETQTVCSVWQMTCNEFDVQLRLTPRIAKIIANRGSHLRGELKTKARPLVEAFYGFESGQNRKIIASNRETAEWLKEHSRFVYKIADDDINKCVGLYQSKLIQKIVNAMWFQDKQDEGVLFVDEFRPFPISALALVLTVIECCLDEWMTGIKTSIEFSAKLYGDVYASHKKHINDFKAYTVKNKAGNLLDSILEKLHNRGRFNAGAQPISELDLPKISASAFAAAVKEYLDDDKTDTDGENGPSDKE